MFYNMADNDTLFSMTWNGLRFLWKQNTYHVIGASFPHCGKLEVNSLQRSPSWQSKPDAARQGVELDLNKSYSHCCTLIPVDRIGIKLIYFQLRLFLLNYETENLIRFLSLYNNISYQGFQETISITFSLSFDSFQLIGVYF